MNSIVYEPTWIEIVKRPPGESSSLVSPDLEYASTSDTAFSCVKRVVLEAGLGASDLSDKSPEAVVGRVLDRHGEALDRLAAY